MDRVGVRGRLPRPARNGAENSGYSNIASATTFSGPTGPCVANSTTLCLNNNRFSVRATYDTGSQSGVLMVSQFASSKATRPSR